jgi:signal transduction histidine kinase
MNPKMIRNPFSMGLLGIKERATAIGADICFESEPGQGTSVIIELHNRKP